MTPVMASLHLSSFHPQTQSLPLSPFPVRTAVLPPPSLCSYYHHQTHQLGFLLSKSPSGVVLRSSVVARLAPSGHHLPDFEAAAGELFGRLEGLVYTVADAAVSSADAAAESSKQNGDWLSGITNYMEAVLKVLKDGLSTLHVPYSYGFAIILLTILVKAVTFPLTKKQVESAIAMRSMQPQVKAIQKRYAGNQEKIQLETARLYKLAGINPLAGCLPTLVTIPIWIGLYRALSNVANEGLLTEGFFWIPSLAGPTTIAARQSGSGISWLFPFVDGHPPLGWSETFAYLVLPVLLIISQYISAQIMQPQQDGDPSQKNAQAVTKFLPLLIGYFSLSVPSGLSLYWLTNNILSTGQQIWLQKLGGAKNPVREFIDSIEDESPASSRAVSNTQKSLVDAAKEKANPNIGEQVSSSGSRPGERFKQLKEQEAKRKKQREEERRKALEAEAVAHVVVEKQNEVKQVETDVEQDLVDNHTKTNLPSTNGGLNSKASSMENDGISPTNDKEKKEETTEMQDSGNSGISPISIDRRDQTAGRE